MRTRKSVLRLPEAERLLLDRCRRAIHHVDPAADVVLYGSRARGDASRDSDYDLLILVDGLATLKTEDAFRRSLYPIELETGAVLTVLSVSRADWESPLYAAMPLHRNISREGLRL